MVTMTTASSNESINIVEVSPRDGLQSESAILPVDVKLAFIKQLTQCGLRRIEVTSFSDPRKIPQLADADAVYAALDRTTAVSYSALVPNAQGLHRALSVGVSAIAVLSSASDAFSRANIGCDNDTALRNIQAIVSVAKDHGVSVRAYISCAYACPFTGLTDPLQVAVLASRLLEIGCSEVALADTTGTSSVAATQRLLHLVAEHLSLQNIAMHFHDTHGQALASCLAAIEAGVGTFDAAVTGLGGCPAAAHTGGNLATERLCETLHRLGLPTGIDLAALQAAGRYIQEQLAGATSLTAIRSGT
jgi:hydroxymethylglutaryl-CoA lyase